MWHDILPPSEFSIGQAALKTQGLQLWSTHISVLGRFPSAFAVDGLKTLLLCSFAALGGIIKGLNICAVERATSELVCSNSFS
jgi:hypothetical protein